MVPGAGEIFCEGRRAQLSAVEELIGGAEHEHGAHGAGILVADGALAEIARASLARGDGLRVFNALVRFGYSLSQMFRDKFQSFDSEDDDIDKKLRQEIEAVKNGQNPTM